MHARIEEMPRVSHVLVTTLAAVLLLIITACSDGAATSSKADDAILAELHALPGATEVGRTSDGSSTVVTYRIEDVPGAAVLEFYLASLPAEWELTQPLGAAPDAIAFCRDGTLLRIDTAGIEAKRTFTVQADAAAEECA